MTYFTFLCGILTSIAVN